MKPRIFTDFNNRDEDNNLVINPQDKSPEGIVCNLEITEGAVVILYDGEMEVEARIKGRYEWGKEFDLWVAIPDWSSIRDTSC